MVIVKLGYVPLTLIPVPPAMETVWSGAVFVMVNVPLPVIGLPDTLMPVPAVAATLVTVPTLTEPPNAVELPLIVMVEFVRLELPILLKVLVEPEIDLFVRVSVVPLPTKVVVASGKVTT